MVPASRGLGHFCCSFIESSNSCCWFKTIKIVLKYYKMIKVISNYKKRLAITPMHCNRPPLFAIVCTVESLSLGYLICISHFLCIWRWCIDKLVIFHANQISICFDSTSEIRVRFVTLNMFKPSNNFLTGRSKAVLLLWILFAICISCHTVLSVTCSIVVTCWQGAVLLVLLYWCFLLLFVTFWCGIWL